ncbi:MAG: acyltransferase [Bacilli bacterium]|nr:acyltransferase [Bacilli bacterium]
MQLSKKNLISKKTFDLIDVFKFLAACSVVFLHCFDANKADHIYMVQIARYGVPFFFIASGYFLFRKYQWGDTKNNFILLKKYSLRIFYLLLFWFIVWLPIMFHDPAWLNNVSWFHKIVRFIIFTIIGKGYYGFSITWYLIASIIGALFITLLYSLRIKPLIIFIILLPLFGLIISFSLYGSWTSSSEWASSIIKIKDPALSPLCGICYMGLACFLASLKNYIEKIPILVCLFFTLLFIIINHFELVNAFNNNLVKISDQYISLPITCTLFLLLGLNFKYKIKYAIYLRNMSTVIYLVHRIFAKTYMDYLNLSYNSWTLYLAVLISAIIISFIIVKAIKNNYFKYAY